MPCPTWHRQSRLSIFNAPRTPGSGCHALLRTHPPRRSSLSQLEDSLSGGSEALARANCSTHPQWPFYEPPPPLPSRLQFRGPRWLLNPKLASFQESRSASSCPRTSARAQRSRSVVEVSNGVKTRRDTPHSKQATTVAQAPAMLRDPPRSPQLKCQSQCLRGADREKTPHPQRSYFVVRQEEEARAAAEAACRKLEEDEAPRLAGISYHRCPEWCDEC